MLYDNSSVLSSSVSKTPGPFLFIITYRGLLNHNQLAWISYYIPTKQWDVITHSCPNFNGGFNQNPVKIRTWITKYLPYTTMDVLFVCMSSSGLFSVSKTGTRQLNLKKKGCTLWQHMLSPQEIKQQCASSMLHSPPITHQTQISNLSHG